MARLWKIMENRFSGMSQRWFQHQRFRVRWAAKWGYALSRPTKGGNGWARAPRALQASRLVSSQVSAKRLRPDRATACDLCQRVADRSECRACDVCSQQTLREGLWRLCCQVLAGVKGPALSGRELELLRSSHPRIHGIRSAEQNGALRVEARQRRVLFSDPPVLYALRRDAMNSPRPLAELASAPISKSLRQRAQRFWRGWTEN